MAWLRETIGPQEKVLAALDSDHACAHVREEMGKYSTLMTPGSYVLPARIPAAEGGVSK